ncbi:MAG: cytochrome P450 [Actinomycetota bacterium]|nr:cytochrome P450 [Actinomycetota bacterium]
MPYVGRALALQRNPFGFLEQGRRRHGVVFKARVLGRPVAFLSGLEGAEAFYRPGNIARAGGHPYPVADMFGGDNMEMLDGPPHLAVKTVALRAFDEESMATYLPDIEALVGRRLAGWARDGGEFSATAEVRKFSIECICRNVMGIEPGATTEAMCRDYALVLKGIVSPPLAIPGTRYGRARTARDRLLSTLRHVVAERRAAPTDDGLSRLLEGGLADDVAALELHHLVIAGFIVYGLIVDVLRWLPELKHVVARCEAEVAEHAPPDRPLRLEGLGRLEHCTRVVMEAKRHAPVMPLAFGRARQPFICGGFTVPEGWNVYLALNLCSTDPSVYSDPERFDPDRFGPGREEHLRHPMAFIPQGAGPPTGHRCLGVEYSTVVVLAFLALLVRDYTWELPPQDLGYRWDTIPPEHRDGLRVRLRPRPQN